MADEATDPSVDELAERFRRNDVLAESLRRQPVLAEVPAAVSALVERVGQGVELRTFDKDRCLIYEGAPSNSIFFLLLGEIDVVLDGRTVAVREANTHVGEMACIDGSALRSATIRARRPTVALELGHAEFRDLAARHPEIWKPIALTLGERLRERGKRDRSPNRVPRVFIGSSSEKRGVAEKIATELRKTGADVDEWTQLFPVSNFTLESIIEAATASDFGVFVGGNDDWLRSRGKLFSTMRDNVLFELGLFMGKLGRKRVVLVLEQEGKKKPKIPTDLDGLTYLPFRYDSTKKGKKRQKGAKAGVVPDSALVDVHAALARLVEMGPR